MILVWEGFCGEGACSRWGAKRPQLQATAAQSNGSKLPRHNKPAPTLDRSEFELT
ncbi:hypothetical protein SAMN03159398_01087 [Pseudomonas sp. NFPP02]|nr:hypothetical protein SAMN03159398_01087 [Pseudomonas sp. NFPP02]